LLGWLRQASVVVQVLHAPRERALT
jgi:hypothetical protein